MFNVYQIHACNNIFDTMTFFIHKILLSSNIMFDFFSTLNKYRGMLSNTYCYGLPNTSKKRPTYMYLPINIQLSIVPV